MQQSLIESLKKILDSKSTQAEKLLKISTLVDFADSLSARPQLPTPPTPPLTPISSPTVAPRPNGPGAIFGVEDVK